SQYSSTSSGLSCHCRSTNSATSGGYECNIEPGYRGRIAPMHASGCAARRGRRRPSGARWRSPRCCRWSRTARLRPSRGAARRAGGLPTPPPPGGPGSALLQLEPSPALQRLLDPYRNPDGPSWLGGDVASSIRLADDRWAWIFGDTLLGRLTGDCADGGAAS